MSEPPMNILELFVVPMRPKADYLQCVSFRTLIFFLDLIVLVFLFSVSLTLVLCRGCPVRGIPRGLLFPRITHAIARATRRIRGGRTQRRRPTVGGGRGSMITRGRIGNTRGRVSLFSPPRRPLQSGRVTTQRQPKMLLLRCPGARLLLRVPRARRHRHRRTPAVGDRGEETRG